MLLIWKIEDQDQFQRGVDGGKGELSKNHVIKGIIENCFGFLHPIELVHCRSKYLIHVHDRKTIFLANFFQVFL